MTKFPLQHLLTIMSVMGMMLFSQGRVIWRFSILCSAHTCCRPYHMQTCPVSSVLTALFFRNWLVPIYPPGLISFQNTALSLCRWPQSLSFTVSGHRFDSLWSFWVPGFGVYSNKPLRSSWYSQGHLHVYCWLLTVTDWAPCPKHSSKPWWHGLSAYSLRTS